MYILYERNSVSRHSPPLSPQRGCGGGVLRVGDACSGWIVPRWDVGPRAVYSGDKPIEKIHKRKKHGDNNSDYDNHANQDSSKNNDNYDNTSNIDTRVTEQGSGGSFIDRTLQER